MKTKRGYYDLLVEHILESAKLHGFLCQHEIEDLFKDGLYKLIDGKKYWRCKLCGGWIEAIN